MSEYLEWERDDAGVFYWADPSDGQVLYGDQETFENWSAQQGYVDLDSGFPGSGYTPDTPDEYGLRDRDVWPNDQSERSGARYNAFQRMMNERNG